jgi:hypothetical protein
MTMQEHAASGENEELTTVAEVEKAAEAEQSADTPAPEAKEGEEDSQAGAEGKPEEQAKEDGEGADGEGQKKPNRVSAKERIAELTRQRREAEQRAQRAEAKLKAYEAPAPKRADFTDDDAYETERAKWAAKAARGDEAKHEAESAKTEAVAAKVEAWNAQRAEIRTRHADFDEVINAVPQSIFNETVSNAILESEMAADVAYVLAKNPERAQKFAAMSPLHQGREIGKIEAEIETARGRDCRHQRSRQRLQSRDGVRCGRGKAPRAPLSLSTERPCEWRTIF